MSRAVAILIDRNQITNAAPLIEGMMSLARHLAMQTVTCKPTITATVHS
jgi:hypothetical protein